MGDKPTKLPAKEVSEEVHQQTDHNAFQAASLKGNAPISLGSVMAVKLPFFGGGSVAEYLPMRKTA